MAKRTLEARAERIRLREPFRISGHVFDTADAIVATIREDAHQGRGEAAGVYYLGEDTDRMLAAVETCRDAVEAGAGREELRLLLPPGGARNALDCSLWELEASLSGRPVWQLAGISEPRPLMTTFTIAVDEPSIMAGKARAYEEARAIKVKLAGEIELDIERVAAVRAARPDVWLGVDANQGFVRQDLDRLAQTLVEQRVSLLEQPLRRGEEAGLEGFRSPIPVAADESALSLADLPGLADRFDVVNIKLDKCGGLTEALEIAREAQRLGLGVMIGNMVGTSLAMAPAFLAGQLCGYVDLDGPIFLEKDREPGVTYTDGFVSCSDAVWGSGKSAQE